MFNVESRQKVTDMDSKQAKTKCIATALLFVLQNGRILMGTPGLRCQPQGNMSHSNMLLYCYSAVSF